MSAEGHTELARARHQSIPRVLQHRARLAPQHVVYTFSRDGELDEVPLTFRELNERMLAAAARLQGMAGRGARVLLLFPPGLDFIIGFHGVLCAGMIAIPVSPPQANRPEMAYRRMVSTLQDSGARVILTTPELKTLLESLLAELPAGSAPTLLTLERLTPEEGATWKDPDIQPGEVAFLQYTSGSTGTPKGVRVTHANMLHNCALIENRISLSPETRTVSWLPFHHDMGLFVNVLLPVYVGYSALLMSPLTFLEKPQRWLRAVSRFRATFSGGPNFAYDLCTRRLTEEDKAELDLSCWKAALNAAEPLRARTLEQFARSFASCGFQFNAFYPCYGLAEGTLMVCGARVGHPVVRHFDIDALDQHQALARPETAPCTRALVGSGWVAPELAPELAAPGIAIVSPETRRQCGDGVVGEIWVSGQSVADGYWQKPELSQEVFGAHLADTGAGPYLRTGDLGLIHQGELFITGRLKDLIILHGRNHYPQDIEETAQNAHPALRPSCVAAFRVEVEDEEQLAIVAEVDRQRYQEWKQAGSPAAAFVETLEAIRLAVAEAHDLQAHTLVLIKPGTIPKTTSGKIRRSHCRELWLKGGLELVDHATGPQLLQALARKPAPPEAQTPRTATEQTVATIWQEVLGLKHVGFRERFVELGGESVTAAHVLHRVNEHFGLRLSLEEAFAAHTVEELAALIERHRPASASDAPALRRQVTHEL